MREGERVGKRPEWLCIIKKRDSSYTISSICLQKYLLRLVFKTPLNYACFSYIIIHGLRPSNKW
jgi:hypothetical protein